MKPMVLYFLFPGQSLFFADCLKKIELVGRYVAFFPVAKLEQNTYLPLS